MLRIILILLFTCFTLITSVFSADLTVYSARHYDVDAKIADLFFKKTGKKVNFINASNEVLLTRLELNNNEKADLLITTDAYNIIKAKEKKLLQPFNSTFVNSVVENNNKDNENYWTAFTKRYRVIVYNINKVNQQDIVSYANLANLKWNKKLILRSSGSSYDIFLIANLISVWGVEKTEKYLNSLLNNINQKPYGKDREQIIAIASGFADIGITNSYYYGQLLNSKDKNEQDLMKNVKLFFPNSKDDINGSHFNFSAVAMLTKSTNVKEANEFIEFLLSSEVQELIMNENYEHPVNKTVKLNTVLQSFGTIKETVVNIADTSKYYTDAVKLIEKTKW